MCPGRGHRRRMRRARRAGAGRPDRACRQLPTRRLQPGQRILRSPVSRRSTKGSTAPTRPPTPRSPNWSRPWPTARPNRPAPTAGASRCARGVVFSDGSTFDSADVVATYAAVAIRWSPRRSRPSVAPIVARHRRRTRRRDRQLDTEADPSPYLLLGILPVGEDRGRPGRRLGGQHRAGGHRALPAGQPAARPGGAGRPRRLLGRPAAGQTLVYPYTPDDNAGRRAWSSGAVDGATLPPRLIDSIDGDDVADRRCAVGRLARRLAARRQPVHRGLRGPGSR